MRVITLVLLSAIVTACDATYDSKPKPVVETAGPPAPPPPIVLEIAANQAVEVQAAEFRDYRFTLPERKCTISGKVEGITGGARDFEVFIMNDENFRNWSARMSAQGIQSGRRVVWSFNEAIEGPGDWHLVVSNVFSVVTAKAVTVQARATCPGT